MVWTPPDGIGSPDRRNGCRDQPAIEGRPDGAPADDDTGVGPITSTAITALVPAPEGFPAGRDFAAWLGLTPLQKSTGGKQKLGAVSKRANGRSGAC
jgi:transposase